MSRVLFAPLLAVSAAAGAASCDGPAVDRPSVVLVLVDQLRKDTADEELREVRALASGGVVFEEMRAVAPWTYPSVISLFTGLYPQQHGADGNQDGRLVSTISEELPLLPRTLRAAGYRTAGFVTNPFLHEWNRSVRGAFDHYDASFIRNEGPLRGFGEFVWTERMWADSVNQAVRAHYDGRALAAPEFTYVHYIDVHGRKEGPERWQGAPFEGSYEAAVRHVDGKIRELHDYFLERYSGNLLFAVTSDHGQDLDDDLEVGDGRPWRWRKASLHDFNLRIPCYLLPSAAVREARVVHQPCANIDLAPTLLDWLGIAPPAVVPGRSLLSAIRGEPAGERALYARNSAFGRLEDCLVHGGRKFMRYLHSDGRETLRLFDLGADPRETRSLDPDSGAERELLLETAGDHGLAFPATFEAPDPEVVRQLNELGYGGDTEAEPAGERDG